eukprot:TRINITY_DN74941_c0_g1_i1.p1 TRINITY_DN74941_c0_g1~~TRINITY_DN74941_c0_g1_i1.p1  ORF type:complete len:377 (+),score=87.38 TRINITY_DN74941_c0_g1_i1:101-1231(+)
MVSRRKRDEKPEEPLPPSILQRLVEEQETKSAEEEFLSDVAVLFCGAKRSGKTSIVDRFINPQKDEKDQPKPTVALEYKFARYASDTSASKVLAHIYDLGGDESNQGLATLALGPASVGNLVVCLVVDLSEPHSVVPSLEQWLSTLRQQVSTSLDQLSKTSPNGAKRVEAVEKAKMVPFAEHADGHSVRPFPVPLVIFGSKWDSLIADTDPEKRKSLCRALRHFAHVNGAALVFSSTKDKAAMNNVRGVLRQMLFGATSKTGLPENPQTDPSKPICIIGGKDSYQAIGAPGHGTGDKAWRDLIATLFPDPVPIHKGPKKTEAELVGDEMLKYPEASVDGMAEQRVEELNQYRRQVERNQRLASEGVDLGKPALAAA